MRTLWRGAIAKALTGGLLLAMLCGLVIHRVHLQPWRAALVDQRSALIQTRMEPQQADREPALDFLLAQSEVAQWFSEVVLLAQELDLEVVALRPQPPQAQVAWSTQQFELQLMGGYWPLKDFLERWAETSPWLTVLALEAAVQAEGLLLTVQLELWLGDVE